MINTVSKIRAVAILVPSLILLTGCGPSADSRYDSGYSDGYAEGYNTACKIRATLVEGDWNDEDYSRGYRSGNTAGTAACRSSK
jgi:hypothetical protein